MLSVIKNHIDSLQKKDLLKMYEECERECNLLREQNFKTLLDDRVRELQYIASKL